MPNGISESLKNIIDSFQHPFYVIDIKSYKIVFANKACAFGDLAENVTCHLRTHKSNTPCSGEHVCPIDEVKKTKKSTITEHIHFDEKGNPRNMEVHGDPIFDETGNVKMMIEYSFDVTDRKKAEQALLKTEQELKKKLEESEKFTKFAVNRELKMVELKKTIEALKKELAESFSDK